MDIGRLIIPVVEEKMIDLISRMAHASKGCRPLAIEVIELLDPSFQLQFSSILKPHGGSLLIAESQSANFNCRYRDARSGSVYRSVDVDRQLKDKGNFVYFTDEIIGRGICFVYKGRFRGEEVAVKLIPTDTESTMEWQALTDLNHTNVIKLVHSEEDHRFRYILLELCRGTLKECVSNSNQFSVPPYLCCLRQMSEGMSYIHSKEIIHKDIKPENILVSYPSIHGEVRLVISDFGHCVLRNRILARGYTTPWTAPEILQQEADSEFLPTTAVDVFSMGLVFFFLISRGGHPFRDDKIDHKTYSIIRRITEGKCDMHAVDGHPCQNIISRMIHAVPNDRPDMEQVLVELQQISGPN